jgi:hypothetical protein
MIAAAGAADTASAMAAAPKVTAVLVWSFIDSVLSWPAPDGRIGLLPVRQPDVDDGK